MRCKMRLDHWGVALSSLCAIHCLAIPALFALLPSLMLALHSFDAPMRPWALFLLRLQHYDGVLVTTALFLALCSFGVSWRHHRCWRPFLWLFTAAVVFSFGLYASRLFAEFHAVVFIVGGILLVIGHACNLRLMARSNAKT